MVISIFTVNSSLLDTHTHTHTHTQREPYYTTRLLIMGHAGYVRKRLGIALDRSQARSINIKHNGTPSTRMLTECEINETHHNITGNNYHQDMPKQCLSFIEQPKGA